MITPHLTLVLHGDAITARVRAQDGTQAPIGLVILSALEDPHHITIQSTSVEHLLQVADCFQDAARQLRKVQLDARRSA